MKKYSNFIIIIITIFFTIEFLINRILVFDAIFLSLNIWVNNIIPALFPFFIISDILISYNFVNYLPKWFISLFKYLFHIKKEAVLVFFLCIISGFPSNAKIARKMYDLGLLDEKEASHILAFTHFSNPLFILGTVSIFFFNDKKIGIIILLAHYLSNIIVGILLRNNGLNIDDYNKFDYNNNINFGDVFINAIKDAINSILLICGTLTSFLVISTIIVNQFNINGLIVKCLLEITIGLKELSLYNFSSLHLAMFSSFIISFGGICIHAQVKSQLIGSNISIKPFILGRIYQAFISLGLAFLFYNLLQ